MASDRITCPDCKSVLRPAKPVPDGKKVKCPKCGYLFTTPGLIEEEEEPPRQSRATGRKKKAAIKKARAPEPPPKKYDDDDEEEGGGIYSFVKQPEDVEDEEKLQIDYAPDMSIKDLRGPAQAAVVKPSNYLLLIGGICCLSNIFLICFQFWPMVFSDSVVDWQKVLRNHYKDDKNAVQRIEGLKERKDVKDKELDIVEDAEREAYVIRFILMGVFIFLLIYNAIAIVGAVKMQNLESRRWGIASSIMTLLPMGSGGLSYLVYLVFSRTIGAWILDELGEPYAIGLGVLPYLGAIAVGVWSLRTLMSQEVIDGFEYIAD